MSALEKIERWQRQVEAFVRDQHINATIDKVFTEYTDEIVAANIILLRKGLRPDGSQITPSYEGWYAWKKRYDDRMNQMDDPERPFYAPNLAISGGEFYEGITVVIDTDTITVTSTSQFWEGYVPPMPGWNRSMTPLHQYYGEVLGITDTFLDDEIMVRVKNDVTDDLHKCFE